MKTYGGGGKGPPFLTSALDGGDWSASCPRRFIPKEIASGIHWIGRCVDPRAGLNFTEKRKSPAGTQIGAVHPVAHLLYRLSYPGSYYIKCPVLYFVSFCSPVLTL
jgi:hypothetical protein